MSLSAYVIPGCKREYLPKTIKQLRPDEIIDLVCEYFSFDIKNVLKKGRERKYVYARYLAAYIMRKNIKITLVDVAKIFNRTMGDHTSVLHGVNFIEGQLSLPDTNHTKEDLDAIMRLLKLHYRSID